MTDKVVDIVTYYNHPAEGGVFVGSKERKRIRINTEGPFSECIKAVLDSDSNTEQMSEYDSDTESEGEDQPREQGANLWLVQSPEVAD